MIGVNTKWWFDKESSFIIALKNLKIFRLDRFTLKGRIKVNIQWMLYCVVHNTREDPSLRDEFCNGIIGEVGIGVPLSSRRQL